MTIANPATCRFATRSQCGLMNLWFSPTGKGSLWLFGQSDRPGVIELASAVGGPPLGANVP